MNLGENRTGRRALRSTQYPWFPVFRIPKAFLIEFITALTVVALASWAGVVPPSRTQRPYEWIERSPPADAGWLVGCLSEYSEQTLF